LFGRTILETNFTCNVIVLEEKIFGRGMFGAFRTGDRASGIRTGGKIAPNAILRVVSCLYIV
jgi:hypothetical protein